MRYYIRSWKKDYFLITPDEFKAVFDGFTFVISNTGVKQGYVSSSPDEIYRKYDKLYQLLSSGKRCVWSEDWETLSFSTGVTSCPENIRYRKTNRLSVPDFKEPSVEIQAFCVRPFKSSPVSKGWEISQSSQNTIGLEMLFPSKIIAEENRVRDFESLSDHATWNELRDRIKKSRRCCIWNTTGNNITPASVFPPRRKKIFRIFTSCMRSDYPCRRRKKEKLKHKLVEIILLGVL